MTSLIDILQQPGMRPQIIQDCVTVLEGEVQRKSGAIGFAIKRGFGGAKKLNNGKFVTKAIDMLLDQFVEVLDGYYQTYAADPQQDFKSYLTARDGEVAESLLGVTDRKRQSAQSKVLARTYDGLRPTAIKQVREAVPALAQLVEKHTGSA